MKDSEDSMLDPIYNIKAVARMTGLPPVTIRAWERRYGIPNPERGNQGYRLYSEEDLQVLQWLKERVDTGMSISRAVQLLTDLRAKGKDPLTAHPTIAQEQPTSLQQVRSALQAALIQFQDQRATDLLRHSLAIYPIDQVIEEVIEPVQRAIGEAWHRGEMNIASEHFVTNFFTQHLMGIISSSPPPVRPGIILAACAPNEMHQVGLLSLVVMLRWRGWDVKYLGADLSLERLDESIKTLRPWMLLFSATLPQSLNFISELPAFLQKLPHPHPLVVVGGQAFSALPDLPEGVHLVQAAGLQASTQKIESLMQANRSTPYAS
ncbi:hypothetical protein ADN00_13285 [Ornatilinea apprima]|uniref:MerR family transcriptional regulator n=1 Tax=Ornatilinea apprima TaxID=1134406 RepID=A0A0P6X637_9CHLR|nr:MerR family transcriptional regulator [Ornatilinea apprima]KPL74814.1 hypothetical protein ADN00_13285 [Ornatilinea apprima]